MLDYISGQKPDDRPDIISRVFKVKLMHLIDDVKKNKHFGEIIALIYMIEFQKRGLPHVHYLVWLHSNDKPRTPSDIDLIISAELPCIETDLDAYNVVSKFMIHGPCGSVNPKSACMKNNRCSKFYPKKYQPETLIDSNGFAIYRRRDDDRFVIKNGETIDNRFVVPHNIELLLKYDAHICIEYCCRTTMVKYLFKYISKGTDRIRAVIHNYGSTINDSSDNSEHVIDEIKTYLDCRYISPCEAAWRIFEFPIHHREPAVEKLVIHLENMNQVLFQPSDNLSYIAENSNFARTMFTEWMQANYMYEDARCLTYS